MNERLYQYYIALTEKAIDRAKKSCCIHKWCYAVAVHRQSARYANLSQEQLINRTRAFNFIFNEWLKRNSSKVYAAQAARDRDWRML
jgi:hypothetical protein